MKLKHDFKNNLLKRREVTFVIEANSNPGLAEAQKVLIQEMNTPEDTIVIKSLKNNYGSKEFIVDAFIYDSKTQKDLIEPKTKIKQGAGTKK